MKYSFNGKSYNIPDDYLSKQMQALKVSKMEAVQMWLEDEGILENDELEALDEKGKAVKVQHGAGNATRKTGPRERKPNPEKRELVQLLADALAANQKICGLDYSKKPEREIIFSIGDNNYTVTLTLHRGK